jgi:hypothetical protein
VNIKVVPEACRRAGHDGVSSTRLLLGSHRAAVIGSVLARRYLPCVSNRPWRIEAVYLFEARQLRSEQMAQGVKRGVASRVIGQREAAEICPSATDPQLAATPMQAEQLRLFAPSRRAARSVAACPDVSVDTSVVQGVAPRRHRG